MTKISKIMENSKKLIIIKLLFNSCILPTAVLTILFGIFQVGWYLQEFQYSEPFNTVWNYSMFTYPYNSFYGPSVYILLSIFFVQGVFTQFIFYRNFDKSILYYFSSLLMILGLFGCLIVPIYFYNWAGEDWLFDGYWQVSSINETILPGFSWGLLSIFLIVIKISTIKILKLFYGYIRRD